MGEAQNGAELTRVNSYQWPAGHVAHLSEGQTGALNRFKKLCQEKGYYTAGDDKTPPSHDDETLLRYLRARKFVPQEAFGQLKDTEDWRKENKLDQLYETIDINEYDQTRRLYPQWTGRRDKRGIPFYVFEIASVDAKDVNAYSNSKDKKKQSTNSKVPWKLMKLFALYENLCRFVLPLCSAIPGRPNPETPISQSNNIVDLHGVGIGKLWNLRAHMSDASKLATAHYPETLDRIFVVGTPSYFPTIWGWAQKWFDPITVSKIFILSQSDMTSTLAKFVDLDNIPKKYGGNLDWNFGDMPNLDPEIANSIQWKENIEHKGHRSLPIGPIKLEYDSNKDLLVTAIGSENGAQRKRVIGGLHPVSGVTTLALSPGRVMNQNSNNNAVTPAAMLKSGDADQDVGKEPQAHVPEASRTGGYTVPLQDNSSTTDSTRAGTSSTRYEQQSGTHAEGQLGDSTPEIRYDGQGEKQAVMEPNTVGQAQKEHPLPEPEEPQPSIIDRAQDMAGQAVAAAQQLPATVMHAVGMGEKKEESAPPAAKKEDPALDAMDSKNVEEFLRSQTMTKSSQDMSAT